MRCGVNPTATNLVAFKRRRIRTRDPKSSGDPQRNRGAEVLAWTWGKITIDFPGFFSVGLDPRAEEEGWEGRGGEAASGRQRAEREREGGRQGGRERAAGRRGGEREG